MFIALGTGAYAAQIPLDGYAAVVNERVITIGEVMEYLRPVEQQLRETYSGVELEEKMEEMYNKSRTALVEEALILADFNSHEEMQIPEQLIDERLNAMIHEQFDDDRALFLEALTRQRMSMEEMREQIKDSLILMILRRQEVADRVSISPLAVLENYENNIEDYEQPGKVQLQMIALNKGKTPEEQQIKLQEIQGIIEQLNKGEDFSALAKEVSEDNKAQYGGDWGWIEAENLRAELSEVATESKPGEISGVIDLGTIMYIMKVGARKAPSVIPLEDVREQIERSLKIKEQERLYNEWINRLRDKFYIRIYN